MFSRFVTVEGIEYHVELVSHGPDSSPSLDVTREPEPGGLIWPYVFSGASPKDEDFNLFDQLRYALRDPQRRMNQSLENWRDFRAFAAAEAPGNVKGSKRAYYTRLANESLRRAMSYAPHWKLSNQLWKEITRL